MNTATRPLKHYSNDAIEVPASWGYASYGYTRTAFSDCKTCDGTGEIGSRASGYWGMRTTKVCPDCEARFDPRQSIKDRCKAITATLKSIQRKGQLDVSDLGEFQRTNPLAQEYRLLLKRFWEHIPAYELTEEPCQP